MFTEAITDGTIKYCFVNAQPTKFGGLFYFVI